jgi:hypothetical protein
MPEIAGLVADEVIEQTILGAPCNVGYRHLADIPDVVPSRGNSRPSLGDGIHTSPRALAVTISVNRRSRCF